MTLSPFTRSFITKLGRMINELPLIHLEEDDCAIPLGRMAIVYGFTISNFKSSIIIKLRMLEILHALTFYVVKFTWLLQSHMTNVSGQFVILKPLSYSFEEMIGFDVKASFPSHPVSRLIKDQSRWCNKRTSSTGLFMDWKLQTVILFSVLRAH